MVIYKIEKNPSQVTCIFSYNGQRRDYMTILPPLKDNTIRLLKHDYRNDTVSMLECDTKGALQPDKKDLVTYPVTQLATIDTSEDFSRKFYSVSPLLTTPLKALFKEKSEISSDELDELMRLFIKAMQSNYKTSDKYPLLAIVDELRPWEIILTNLTD